MSCIKGVWFFRHNLLLSKEHTSSAWSGYLMATLFLQGILEHFEPEEARNLLDQQLTVARRVIFSIPSVKQNQKDFGDEHLWSYREWLKILKGYSIIHSFGFMAKMNRLQSLAMFPLYFIAPSIRAEIKKRCFDTQIGFVLERKSR